MRQFIKKLELPPGVSAPRRLAYEDIEAIALSRADLDDDLRAINDNIGLIQRTRGGGCPTGPVEADFNFVDLVWHEQEFREGSSFSYVLRHEDGAYLGCCYFYPLGLRTELSEEVAEFDVDASWWVVQGAYDEGYYERVYLAMNQWLEGEFGGWKADFSNLEIPG